MVLHKRLDYGSIGHLVPPMPRVPRSARGKRSARKKIEIEDKQISAFDLLATVAGELLSERENSPPPCKTFGVPNPPPTLNGSIKQEQQDVEMSFKAEVFDQGSCNESTLGSETVFKRQANGTLKEHSKTPKSLEKDAGDGKRGEFGCASPAVAKKCFTEGISSGLKDHSDCKAEVGIKTPLHVERRMNGNVRHENAPEILEDSMDLDAKPPALVSSDSSVEVPISRNGSFQFRDEMELLVNRDDDENSSGCTHPSTNSAKAFRPQRIGDRRIRKLLASRFWKVPPTTLKDGDLLNTDVEMKPVFRSRKMCYTRQRTQRSSFKRRKLFEHRSISASAGCTYGEGISNSLKFGGLKIETSEAHANLNGENGASSSTSGQKSSYESGDFHVKFSIKSFKVPELFIEIPENATVGSLKRTVMEAVTAILTGGMRVGVLLQEKKVRDDKQTLLQAGISRNVKMENLGFTLEANSAQTPSLTCPEDPNPNPLLPSNPVLPCASAEPVLSFLNRTPVVVPAVEQAPPEPAPELPQSSTLNIPESDHDSVHSQTGASSSIKTADSKALIPLRDMNADPLTILPPRKTRRSELVQRRIRRPFSVAEVEALVQAVEKLGTGRWRDVKIRAFDNAKHRTYVDLKDKWKTLVHTARITPQQRRGEPVPQELLDRVLSAHVYWSQQQGKPSPAETCLLI